jgi:IS30 family transposase
MNRKKVNARRKRVASLLAQAATEDEIAQELDVGQSTISRDIKHLKIQARQFVDIGQTQTVQNTSKVLYFLEQHYNKIILSRSGCSNKLITRLF